MIFKKFVIIKKKSFNNFITLQGDSGGGMIKDGKTIVSIAIGSSQLCDEKNGPGIYIKVFDFLDFIETVRKIESNKNCIMVDQVEFYSICRLNYKKNKGKKL